jgi:hypothetical protein
MSPNPNSYPQAATARVRLGLRRCLHSIDPLPPIAPTSALVASGMAVPK